MNKLWTNKVCLPLLFLALITFAGSFDPEVNVLDKKEIAQLSEENLIDTYMDTLVEIEASRTFHTTSGFSPKDYKTFKSMLKFRMLLIRELHSRGIELPKLE